MAISKPVRWPTSSFLYSEGTAYSLPNRPPADRWKTVREWAFNPTVSLAGIAAYAYAFALVYDEGYCNHLHLPFWLISPTRPKIVGLWITVFLIFAIFIFLVFPAIYLLSELLQRVWRWLRPQDWVPAVLLGVGLVFGLGLVFAYKIGAGDAKGKEFPVLTPSEFQAEGKPIHPPPDEAWPLIVLYDNGDLLVCATLGKATSSGGHEVAGRRWFIDRSKLVRDGISMQYQKVGPLELAPESNPSKPALPSAPLGRSPAVPPSLTSPWWDPANSQNGYLHH